MTRFSVAYVVSPQGELTPLYFGTDASKAREACRECNDTPEGGEASFSLNITPEFTKRIDKRDAPKPEPDPKPTRSRSKLP